MVKDNMPLSKRQLNLSLKLAKKQIPESEALDYIMREIEDVISPSLADNTDVEKLLVNLSERIRKFMNEQFLVFYRP